MSPDFDLERLLREARTALPEPDRGVTGRARDDALAAARHHRPRRLGVAAISAAGFVVALALGIGIGALVVPSGHAAKDAVGFGFLPAPGWTAFQTGGELSPVFQTVAVASNVPLDPEDQAAGVANPSGLPYATLQKLPTDGVVIVASFTRLDDSPWARLPDALKRALPLRLRDATHYVQYGTQIRPEDPLGQWEIRAVVNGHYVDVIVYFGTPTPSAAIRADADRQLARLVVQRVTPASTGENRGARGSRDPAVRSTASATARVVERTLSCTTGIQAGAHVVYVGAQTGTKSGGAFQTLAQAYVTTAGTRVASRPNQYQPQLVAMTAGYPAKPPLTGGGVGYDGKRCTPVKTKVPFTRRGLVGGIANQFGEQSQCFPPGRVLVHFRVVFAAPPTVTVGKKSRFYSALGRIEVGQMAVRTSGARPLAYLDVVDRATARAFTAGSCV